MTPIKTPKKLIEVALPLDKINQAAAREKSIRHGHPSTLHLWWARRPLAAARAVIFAQMVNDPGYERHLGRGVNKEKAAIERERLFKIIEDLVQWENTNNEEVLARAREEIWKSWRETCALNKHHPQAAELFNPDKLPAFHDPFAGGGAIPLEAQRLGLESYASDLNPVAVTINKAMIEIPPRFAGHPPVGPLPPGERQPKLHEDWSGARGLAEDVRRYGTWVRNAVEQKIGHLYPKVKITAAMVKDRPDIQHLVGQEFTAIAWLWARTVKSPNPAFSSVDVPLVRSFWVSAKEGKEAWVDPVIDRENGSYSFVVRTSGSPKIEQTVGRKGATCIMSDTPIPLSYIRSEAKAGRLGQKLFAIVVEGPRGRLYLSPSEEISKIADQAEPAEPIPSASIDHWAGCTNCVVYGLENFEQLFSKRQLAALTHFSDAVISVREKVFKDAVARGMSSDDRSLSEGGKGARAYSEAISVLLAFVVDKCTDYWSTMCTWHNTGEKIGHTFGRQAIPMSWDYAETNVFSDSSGNWLGMVQWVAKVVEALPAVGNGFAVQHDAATLFNKATLPVVSTDPPYYDNVPYSNISDYFYIWLRRCIRDIYPSLFATIRVPKMPELVANQFRHGGKEKAFAFFMNGMQAAISQLRSSAHPAFPVTIYYAFKASETEDGEGTSSSGWETFLQAVIDSGFSITGTWPMRTEMAARRMAVGNNALASSVVLVCKRKEAAAPTVSRREFLRELNATLPEALAEMTRGGVNSPVAPVDLSQAIIGPGMAIFSQYAAVLEADGTPMRVKTALQLINRFLAEDDFDHDTQFCLHWFEQHGWATGTYGEADVLARAKGTSVNGLQEAGVVESSRGELRLLRWQELPADWSPESDNRTPVWEALHQLIRALNQEGESAAGALLARMPARAEPVRALVYRLYTLCERKGWAEEARAYNELVSAWSGIEQASAEAGIKGSQAQLDI
jgi:putative DNA methylase